LNAAELLAPTDTFPRRHLGPSEADVAAMLRTLGTPSLEALVAETVPDDIRLRRPLDLPAPRTEQALLEELREIAGQNQVYRSFLGMGYHDCITPPVILRNLLENPGWYTPYTPYQAEISQGRLESLLNFQTMVSDLTGLPLANASLLDEATAAAEAMHMCHAAAKDDRRVFFAAEDCHPQTLAVVRTRARALGLEVVVGRAQDADFAALGAFGVLLQYPATDGAIRHPGPVCARAHAAGALVVMATDLLALTLLRPPGEIEADVAVGSSQRFGVPMSYGGPHAAFLATRQEHKRRMPGRLVGVSKDAQGRIAYRLALQTREQHIRREKATSNICTAQALLANIAAMYAVWHGPEGLTAIARRVHALACVLARGLSRLGFHVGEAPFFDTLCVRTREGARIVKEARERRMNLRLHADGAVGIALDETTTARDVAELLEVFAAGRPAPAVEALAAEVEVGYGPPHRRESAFLAHPVFQRYHTEHELLRYLSRLQGRDLSLTTSMIPLGSCTMKLNAAVEMLPITWREISGIHPYAPAEQATGYRRIVSDLERWLAELTGFPAVSLQPNSGAQGEYAGLLAIRRYHESRGERHRNVCLIPVSAHGTNPASSVMAGFRVVAVACDDRGNVDLGDLEAKSREHEASLGALMITYPSTHGVFEKDVRRLCEIVHAHGGQVYLDGANMNAQVGLTRPAEIGADVCHLNLHKTFAIPHGGGGPGMGPIAAAPHLAPFLPGDPLGGEWAVCAAPWGSAGILPISWAYIALMGPAGLRRASEVAILNANYMAKRLEAHYPILYTGARGRVAHELIADVRAFKKTAGVEAMDIAKRLMDYGFHAPTVAFPVAGTLMIEPTESESMAELDRFCDALIGIREEIRAVEEGRMDREDNPLKNAPHTALGVAAADWPHPYTREQAAFPAPWVKVHKFWPPVARIDDTAGDRQLVCTCPPVEAYA
jgi:glycine dehydrogenase